jgi:alpha-D-ribose 1-methylphosphonate 5-triphosphate synthase subunit PhnH
MTRETLYNEIFDTQRHFRTLLDCMARPGKIGRLAAVAVTPPPPLLAASAYVAFTLLNADATFNVTALGAGIADYLRANTQARPTPLPEADFVFAEGSGDEAFLHEARTGIATYPETGATVVLQVANLGRSSSVGGLQLTLEGPGVEGRTVLLAAGLNPACLEVLKQRNAEFPLGIDAILTAGDGLVACLPRTTRVTWQTL